MSFSDNNRISSTTMPFCSLPEEVLFEYIVKDLDVKVWKVFSECSHYCHLLANDKACKSIKVRNDVLALRIHSQRSSYTVFQEIESNLSLLKNPANILMKDLAEFIGPDFENLPIYDLNEIGVDQENIFGTIRPENIPHHIMRGLDLNKRPFIIIKTKVQESGQKGLIKERCAIVYVGKDDDHVFLSYRYDDGFVRYTKRRRSLGVVDIFFANIRTYAELAPVKDKIRKAIQ